jgi:hypothetical protein
MTCGKADFDAEAAMNDHLENLRRDDGLLVLIDIQKALLDPCVDAD